MSTLALDGTLPRSRTKDPTTSVDAGRAADLNASQREVLETPHDLRLDVTDRELVEFMANRGSPYTPQRIRSARAELTDAGLVVCVEGAYGRSPSGRREQVWQLTEEEN